MAKKNPIAAKIFSTSNVELELKYDGQAFLLPPKCRGIKVDNKDLLEGVDHPCVIVKDIAVKEEA